MASDMLSIEKCILRQTLQFFKKTNLSQYKLLPNGIFSLNFPFAEKTLFHLKRSSKSRTHLIFSDSSRQKMFSRIIMNDYSRPPNSLRHPTRRSKNTQRRTGPPLKIDPCTCPKNLSCCRLPPKTNETGIQNGYSTHLHPNQFFFLKHPYQSMKNDHNQEV